MQAQALAEKNEDEAYDRLDAEIAATRVRREAILAEDIDYDVHRILINSISTKSMVRAIHTQGQGPHFSHALIPSRTSGHHCFNPSRSQAQAGQHQSSIDEP